MVIKLKNFNCDKTQIVKEKSLNNSKCGKTKNKTMTKLKNSNCDKTQKLKLRQNLKFDQSQFMKKKTLKGSFRKTI